jgi:flagellin
LTGTEAGKLLMEGLKMYGFRINHNIAAVNTYRQLTRSTASLERSLERLSSGLRINRAADDVAGLAISQRMRAQVIGLQQASRNASQAINMVQTAEGALNQIHDILTRMRELAVEAASDNISSSDRTSLNLEFQQLKLEITQIASSTEYNNMKLLDGSFYNNSVNWSDTYTLNSGDLTASGVQEIAVSDIASQVGDVTSDFTINDASGAVTINQVTGYIFQFDDSSNSDGALTLQLVGFEASITDNSGNTTTLIIGYDSTAGAWEAYESLSDYQTRTESGTYTVAASPSDAYLASQEVAYYNAPSNGATLTLSFDNLGVSITLNDSYDDGDLDGKYISVDSDGDGAYFQVGADNTSNDRIELVLSNVTASNLGLDDTVTLSSMSNARSAIDSIDTAIETINTERARLGAIQNRLNFTISNLDNIAQNVQASESTIRDVDFAQEITEFTRSQILVQAATAMLAQSNAVPQNVLSLLQGR